MRLALVEKMAVNIGVINFKSERGREDLPVNLVGYIILYESIVTV